MAAYLLDTNVLLRLLDRGDERHGSCKNAVERLHGQGDRLCLAAQVLAEFWVVATRPAGGDNGLGWPVERAREAVDQLLAAFDLLPEPAGQFERWLALITQHAVRGKNAHDARLAAFALAHDLAAILSFNARHFQRFGVPVLHPQALAGEGAA